jgi:hypothetical protein
MAASLHDRPFVLYVDHGSDAASADDAFTFDLSTGELIPSDDAGSLVDALLDMAMFQHGFNTFMGKRRVENAIRYRYVALRPTCAQRSWTSGRSNLAGRGQAEIVERFDLAAFSSVLYRPGTRTWNSLSCRERMRSW